MYACCEVCSFSQWTADSRTLFLNDRYNQVISIDKLLPDMKFGKARTNAAKANLPDEAPQLPDEGDVFLVT